MGSNYVKKIYQPKSLRSFAVKAVALDEMGIVPSQSAEEFLDVLKHLCAGSQFHTANFDKATFEKLLLKICKFFKDKFTSKEAQKKFSNILKLVAVNKPHVHSLHSLGFFRRKGVEDEATFFDCKFGIDSSPHCMLSVPVLTEDINRLLPDVVDVAGEILELGLFDFFTFPREDDFYKLLRGLFHTFRLDRQHEALAFCGNMMDNSSFKGHPDYYQVFGILAAVLSKLARPVDVVRLCLIQMKKFANMQLQSDRFNCLVYCQMASSYSDFGDEHLIFQTIDSSLPNNLLLHNQSVLIHIECGIKKIEDMLMIGQCFQDLANASVTPDECISEIKEKVEEIECFIHRIVSVTDMDLDGHLATVDLLKLCWQHLENPFFVRKRKTLRPTKTSADFFIGLISSEFDMDVYKRLMRRVKSNEENLAHRTNTVENADLAVSHAIFLSCLHRNNFRKYDFFQQARDTYARASEGRHKRIAYLDQCLSARYLHGVESEFEELHRPRECTTRPDEVTFKWFLQSDSFLRKMTRFGIASCEKNY
jgi:hypothetical protein